MKAFIGRSFRDEDVELIRKIAEFVESQGVDCGDAKSAKSAKVEEKVSELISACDIFIGVFTRYESLCKNKKPKWYCKPQKEDTEYSTSIWVIQESGFAIGKDRKLILLKEDGVCELPKLQGNLEYIPFNRNNLEDVFLKIGQMINHMKAQVSGGTAESSSGESTSLNEAKSEECKGQPKKEMQDEKERVLNKVWSELIGNKDFIEAQRLFDQEAEALLDQDDKVPTRALVLRYSQPLGDNNAFEKLQKIVQENKDNPRVIKQLAYLYKDMGELEKAKEHFLLATEKYDIHDTEKKTGLIEAYVQAAWCIADNTLGDALSLLQKLFADPNFQDSKAKIFKGMAEISKDKDDIERFFIYAEAALDIEPCDTDFRFTLAYAYSQNNDTKLSLLHYKILTNSTINSTAMNNLGVQYDAVKLKCKCIQTYRKSANQNETLAMANLAQKYLNEGFIKDARELVNEANKLSNEGVRIDYRVGRAQERINNLTEEEDIKENAILADAKKERRFRIDYSKAFCSETTLSKENFDGTWETPWGDFKLKFDEKTKSFSINETKKIECSGSHLFPATPPPTKTYKDRHVEINGTIENISGNYKIEVEEKIGSTLLTAGKTHEATGYMIINDSHDCIRIMEKTKDNKIEFKQWKKHKGVIKGEE